MPTFYNFRENGVDYSFDDIFVPADLFRDGNLFTWGSGALGNGVSADRSTPVTTSAGGANWKQVSAGTAVAAIKTDGTLWTWGDAGAGRLGNAVITGNRLTPVTTFAGGNNWKQVSCGYQYTAAIKTDGTLWTWGNGALGRLGNAVTTNRSTPVTTFAGGNNWKQVSCGNQHTAAIKTDGTLWTWGGGEFGSLGNAVTTNRSTPVTTFAGGTNWKEVSAGRAATSSYVAAIKTDGTLWTWGYGGQGKLGINSSPASVSTPVTTFSGGTNWKQVSCGYRHTAAIKTDGTLWTWGSPSSGVLGNAVDSFSPQQVPITTFSGGTNWKQVSAGKNHTAAIKTDGTLWTWGGAQFASGFNVGQLGNGITTGSRSTPVTTFAGGTNWKQVSAFPYYTAAVTYIDPVI